MGNGTPLNSYLGLPPLPREHGAWSMIVIPWLIGAGTTRFALPWAQVSLLAAMLAGYCASSAFLATLRASAVRREPRHLRWAVLYGLIAALLLVWPVALRPALAALPILAILPLGWHALLAARHTGRVGPVGAFLGSAVTILVLAAIGPAAYALGAPTLATPAFATLGLDRCAFVVWCASAAFFVGSLFFVKSMIRARRSRPFFAASVSFHLGSILAFAAAAYPLIALALIPSLLRATLLRGRSLRPLTLGLIELANSLLFSIGAIAALRGPS